MAKILLVKTSSLGDLIHTMPAITDMQAHLPDAELHWLVEEGLADIPLWHPFVKKVHRCAIRRWRKALLNTSTQHEIRQLKQALQAEHFDIVIDAQGLLKSALMVRWLSAEKHGYDRHSIKEKLASTFYDIRHAISREMGAVERVRQLFAEALAYTVEGQQQFGLQVKKPAEARRLSEKPYVIFLQGTVWNSKVWPVAYWNSLANDLSESGFAVFVPWGNAEEHERAQWIVEGTSAVVLDRQPLNLLAWHLQQAEFVVGSDTGLTHVAAALSTKTIGIYGATSTRLTGLLGAHVVNLASSKDCSPCFKRDCPLISEGEMIPCYASVNPGRVLAVLQAFPS